MAEDRKPSLLALGSPELETAWSLDHTDKMIGSILQKWKKESHKKGSIRSRTTVQNLDEAWASKTLYDGPKESWLGWLHGKQTDLQRE